MRHPRFLRSPAALALASLAFAAAASPAPVQWRVEDGGNGHYYETVRPLTNPSPTWTAARDDAAARAFAGAPGHLATITSEAERQFINDQFQSFVSIAWIGGIQAPDPTPGTAPDEGWSWVTGEPWGYTAWMNGEPNDWAGTDERYLSTWVGPGTSGGWNDNGNAGTPRAYIVEYPAVPEPASAALPLTLAALALRRRTRGTSR